MLASHMWELLSIHAPRKGEFSRCTKIPEVVSLTCSLKLRVQWARLLLRILPFVSVIAPRNPQSTQNSGILQVSSDKASPAAKEHSSHDPHSLHRVVQVICCTNRSHRASTMLCYLCRMDVWERTWGFTSPANMRYDLSMPLVICLYRSNIWCMSKWSWWK